MKKIILIAVALLTITTATNPAIPGIPITDDQYAHLFFASWTSSILKSNDLDLIQSVLVVGGIGVLKEFYDMNRTWFSWSDIGFNISGVFLHYSIDDLIGGNNVPTK